MTARQQNLVYIALLALAAFAVSQLRAPLSTRFQAVKDRDDVYPLPAPDRVVLLSLGYRSALADLIFAHVLVSSGIHFQEKRSFEFVGQYLETVNALDPKFEMPYRMADGLITLQAKPVSPDAYREARRILERGMAELPVSQALWTSAGQFLAYLGPTGNIAGDELTDWKRAGARALARSCELVGSNERPPAQCIVAAGLLTKTGEAAASRQFVERMLSVSDDPGVRKVMNALLEQAIGAEQAERLKDHRYAFVHAWTNDLPFVTRGALLALGPHWNSAACAGPDTDCATSWRAWSEASAPDQGATSAFNTAPSVGP